MEGIKSICGHRTDQDADHDSAEQIGEEQRDTGVRESLQGQHGSQLPFGHTHTLDHGELPLPGDNGGDHTVDKVEYANQGNHHADGVSHDGGGAGLCFVLVYHGLPGGDVHTNGLGLLIISEQCRDCVQTFIGDVKIEFPQMILREELGKYIGLQHQRKVKCGGGSRHHGLEGREDCHDGKCPSFYLNLFSHRISGQAAGLGLCCGPDGKDIVSGGKSLWIICPVQEIISAGGGLQD